MRCSWPCRRSLNRNFPPFNRLWRWLAMSQLKVVIPTPLRKFTSGAECVDLEAGTIQEVLDSLEQRFPGFRSGVCDESGGLRRFINIYLNGEDVRFLKNLATPVNDGA